MGQRLTPDRKTGYTVAIQGVHGDRRCESWFRHGHQKILAARDFCRPHTLHVLGLFRWEELYIYGRAIPWKCSTRQTLKLTHDAGHASGHDDAADRGDSKNQRAGL